MTLTISDPILIFAILCLILLIAPLLSERLRVPDLVLLLGFGALLGPNGLHVLGRDTAITLLGSVGMLYIMFLAGVEIDLYRFAHTYKRSVAFGLLTFILPQGLGTLVGYYLLGMGWPTALLLASMFASHTLLAYPQASRLGITRSEPVAITVGATIITDTLALLVLAVIADSARGFSLGVGFWGTILLGMLALTVLTWKGIPLVTRWFFERVTEKSNAQFLFVIVIVCACAYLSHFARLEPIIGAFFAGAAFNRLIPKESPLMSRVLFAGHTLFIPIFLLSVGMLVDPRAMVSDPRSWAVGAAMVGTVVITKYMAAHLARRLMGYSRAAGQVMFGLSVVQAAATLAALMVGYNLKIFDEPVLNGAIFMILVTCPLGSWMVDRHGRRMAAESPVEGAPSVAEQRLIVPVSTAESATRLLDLAFVLRNPARPGGIYPVAIIRDRSDVADEVAKGEAVLRHCIAHAASADASVHSRLRVGENVADEITHVARELRGSQVVLAWSGKQPASIRFFGSLMHQLGEECGPRLLFYRMVSPLNTTRRLLVPFAPFAPRRRELSEFIGDAKRLTERIGAELHFYAISSEVDVLQSMIDAAKPQCRVVAAHAADWTAVQESFYASIRPGDTLLLPLDRRNGVLWTYALDGLPERTAEQFAQVNVLVDYPSLPGVAQEVQAGSAVCEADLPLLPVDLDPEATVEQAIERMAEAAFHGRSEPGRIALGHVLTARQAEPTVLASGIVLLDARFEGFASPMLVVCHAPSGLPIPELPTLARIILVLLGAQSLPLHQHRRTLAIVMRWMLRARKHPEFADTTNARAFCEVLRQIAPQPEDELE